MHWDLPRHFLPVDFIPLDQLSEKLYGDLRTEKRGCGAFWRINRNLLFCLSDPVKIVQTPVPVGWFLSPLSIFVCMSSGSAEEVTRGADVRCPVNEERVVGPVSDPVRRRDFVGCPKSRFLLLDSPSVVVGHVGVVGCLFVSCAGRRRESRRLCEKWRRKGLTSIRRLYVLSMALSVFFRFSLFSPMWNPCSFTVPFRYERG